jgi:hypothetical protein
MTANRKYLVDTVFPYGGLHILGGPSSAGKTTLLMQTAHAIDHAQPVFGSFASHPCEWVYVSGDRSLAETNATLNRLGYSDWDIPCYAMEDLALRDSGGLIDQEPSIIHIAERFPDAELLMIEGLQGFLPNTQRGQSQNKAEQIWVMRIRDQILNPSKKFPFGRIIIATTHTAKSKQAVGGMDKRNTFLGSAALIGACSTCISFDIPLQQQQPGSKPVVYNDPGERLVTIMGRDFRDIELNYSRDKNGAFVLETSRTGNVVEAHTTPNDQEMLLDFSLMAHPHDVEIRTYDLKLWAMKSGIADPHFLYKWLRGKIENGVVQQIMRGRYKRIRAQ